MTSKFEQTAHNGHTTGWPREKFWHFSLFSAFLSSLAQEEYNTHKRIQMFITTFFDLKHFSSFFQHGATCWNMSVMFVIFTVLWLSTLPTKLYFVGRIFWFYGSLYAKLSSWFLWFIAILDWPWHCVDETLSELGWNAGFLRLNHKTKALKSKECKK